MMLTGAVVCGRGTIEPAGFWGGDHHNGVPIFVLSRERHEAEEAQWSVVTYMGDVRTAIARAKQAAGERNVPIEVVDGPGATHLRYRVSRSGLSGN